MHLRLISPPSNHAYDNATPSKTVTTTTMVALTTPAIVFCSKDPIGYAAGSNCLYEYCHGKPYKYIDPWGKQIMPPTGPSIHLPPESWPAPVDPFPAPRVPGSGGGALGAVCTLVTIDLATPEPTDLCLPKIGVEVAVITVLLCVDAVTRPQACPPCPLPPAKPPELPRVDRVPPSKPHFPCPGDHLHVYWWETRQDPVTCQCFNNKMEFVKCL